MVEDILGLGFRMNIEKRSGARGNNGFMDINL
jgi:hypothetical protein